MIIIFFIICIIYNMLDFETKNNYFLLYFFTFLNITLYCLTYVLFKYILIKTYMSSFEILFIQGIIELILTSILITILINNGVLYNFMDYLSLIKQKGLYKYILLIFLNFTYYSNIYIIIDIFSPFYIYLTILVSFIFCFLILYDLDWFTTLVSILIICVGLFLILVFIEIIELNCFGISYMTKRNIQLRARLDSELNEDDSDKKSNSEIPFKGYIIKLRSKETKELALFDSNSSNEE